MSRTLNTMPYQVQKRRRERWRDLVGRYPSPFGGAWPGRKGWARIRNRKFRRAASVAIAVGKEIPGTVRNVAWDVW